MDFKLDADSIGAMPINEKRYLSKKSITLWHGFYILAKNIMTCYTYIASHFLYVRENDAGNTQK